MLSDYVLPRPQEGPQTDFSLIRDDVYMVFYGGAMVSSGSLIGNNKKITLLIR
jgi:hypothetical protein